jgi:hypothetical protein
MELGSKKDAIAASESLVFDEISGRRFESPEKPRRVRGGLFRDLAGRHPAKPRQRLRHVSHKGRLVTPASHRLRGQIRAICLNEQLVQRHKSGRLSQFPGVGERQRSRERYEKARPDQRFRGRPISRETVQHPAQPASGVLFQNRQAILVRLAAVNHHGQIEPQGHPNLRLENRPLNVARQRS